MSVSLFTRHLLYQLHNKLISTLEHNSAKVIRSKACLSSQLSTQVSPVAPPVQWRIMTAVCLERKPVLPQDMIPLEKSYAAMLTQLEHERSLLSDHELRHKEDMQRAEKLKKDSDDVDIDAATKQTAQEFEDACSDELQKFNAWRETQNNDNATDDVQLSDRRPQNNLLFIVREKLGNEYKWILPQTAWKEGENLRESAERAIKEVCGDNLQVTIMGNAPCGFYKYKYPKAARDEAIGAKVFFFKAQVKKGTVDVNPSIEDYAWVTRGELKEKLQMGYLKAVENFLVDESPEL